MDTHDIHSDLKILHENEMGYIGICPNCREIQIAVGNVLSHVSEEGFYRLYKGLTTTDVQLDHRISEMPDGQRIVLRTSAENMMISLSLFEYKATIELFNRAILMLQVNELIREY